MGLTVEGLHLPKELGVITRYRTVEGLHLLDERVRHDLAFLGRPVGERVRDERGDRHLVRG